MNNDPLFEYLSSAEFVWDCREAAERSAELAVEEDIEVWLDTGRVDQLSRG